ncbi:hypothetical protein F5Y06DRAFT_75227 [Hypoxylon sp. FL0890]|nr:hypothetical protein F5Y06DRAFT_75227 [Hypoxylon sp. FL0890]
MDSDNASQESLAAAEFYQVELLNALECIYPASSFAGSVPAMLDDLDIFVQGIGRINIPLSEAQAKEIAVKSHQAPYGKGSETIVDTSVRNTWELNPDQFEIRAPDWQVFLDNALAYVREQLGLRSPISAELYKMLLYEEGAMFKAHTDTEKIPRMFGTLVISLPSSHEGGDVVLTHQGRSYRYRSSQHDMSCAFWFSDVSHEVLPVKSGYRWVLTYNLAIDQSAEVPRADGFADHREIRRVLQSWSQEINIGSRKASPLYFVLAHKYTEANISYEGLKPSDLEVVKSLREVCPELSFDLFLTTLEKKESGLPEGDQFRPYYRNGYDRYEEKGGVHHALEEVHDVSYCSKYIFDLGGSKLVSYVPLDMHNILHGKAFEDKPDEEDYEGFMGNWGPTATHWYRLSALVIIPCQGTVSFLLSDGPKYLSKENFRALCTYFTTRCTESSSERSHAQLYEFVSATCYSSSSLSKYNRLAGNDLLKVLQTSILIQEPELLDLILANNEAPIPIDFFKWIRGEHDNSRITTEKFEKAFLHALETQTALSQQYQAILAVEGEKEPTDEIHEVILRAVDECINSHKKFEQLFEEDGSALFDLSLHYHEFSYVKETVLPIIEGSSSWTALILGFLKALHQSMKRQQIPEDRAQPMYEHVARLALRDIDLASLIDVDNPSEEKDQGGLERADLTKQYVTYDSMLKFVSALIALKLEKHLELLAEKLGSQAKQINGHELSTLWIPLLQMVLPILELQMKSVLERHWIQMSQTLIKAYLRNYVKEKPLKPTLSRQRVPCSCRDCNMYLNPFLVSANERTGRFPIGEKRRRHLENKLYQADVDCTAYTERSGNPHTLVVTKTTEQHGEALDAWWKRRNLAEKQFEAFDQKLLMTVLDDQFDEITSMKSLEPQEQAATSRGSLSSSSQHPPVPPENVSGNPADQPRQLNAVIACLAGPSSTTPNASSTPKPTPTPTPLSSRSRTTASASRPAPSESMLDLSRRISESALQRTNQSTPLGPPRTVPNPVAGAKRKYAEVIDLTGDD